MTRRPPTLKIAEVFPSIQGEGLQLGSPAIFIRFSGCNLRCSFCDTQYAWDEGRQKSVKEITEEIQSIHAGYPARWVCLTGGEPLLQDIGFLVKKLKKMHFSIQLETNATQYRSLPVDWVTISPKPDKYIFHPDYINTAREVKIVVTNDLDFSVILRMRKAFPEKIPIWLQPQSATKWSTKKAKRILKASTSEGLPNIRLGTQLHRHYGLK
jgi:7-cyano-7-deazaguanosine (preQ0) biosynthesis protein QueE